MTENHKTSTIFVQVVDRPARKLILKRGVEAADYYAYCEEVGCEVWDVLTGIQQALYEPVGMWLPANHAQAGHLHLCPGSGNAAGLCRPHPGGI